MTTLWVAKSVPSNHISSLYDPVTAVYPFSRCILGFSNSLYSRPARRHCLDFLIYEKRSRLKLSVAGLDKKTHWQRNIGVWEQPDDGSGIQNDGEHSEGDKEEEIDFGNGRIEESNVSNNLTCSGESAKINYAEVLVKEVEQLLCPNERAILQENSVANLRKISTGKWYPLHTLALSLQIHCMDLLLANGVDINFVDKVGLTALHKAVIGKKLSVIIHLLRKGANPHIKDQFVQFKELVRKCTKFRHDGATPLHYAVQVSDVETMKLLIKYKVDVNAADYDGWTPLHIAMQSRRMDVAKLLLVNGADRTRKNKDGKTAFDLSLCFGKGFNTYALAKLLKSAPENFE